MRAMVLGIAMGLVMGMSALAQEDTQSANYMLRYCQAFLNDQGTLTYRLGQCVGIVDGIYFLARRLPLEDRGCPPNDWIPLGQLVRVVVAYIEARPQRMHENFKELAVEAIHNAWPCKSD